MAELNEKIKEYIEKLPAELQPIVTEAAFGMITMSTESLLKFLMEMSAMLINGDPVATKKLAYSALGVSDRIADWEAGHIAFLAANETNFNEIEAKKNFARNIVNGVITVGIKIIMGFLLAA